MGGFYQSVLSIEAKVDRDSYRKDEYLAVYILWIKDKKVTFNSVPHQMFFF